MTDLRNWTKVSCVNTTFFKRYTQVVAKFELVLWFKGRVQFCLLALITLSIFVRCSKIGCQILAEGFSIKLNIMCSYVC